jgi:uroporphyrinogen decarboxylase
MELNLMIMNGKEILLKALRHEEAPRIPWVPFTGIHAGSLKKYSATEILTDGKKLLSCLLEAHKLYTPDGMPVIFDLQVEAEILGCELKWADKAPPSVTAHPLSGKAEISLKIPLPSEGRLPTILDVMKNLKDKIGSHTALFGLICGPLTLAMHLRGTEFFMDLLRNKEFAIKLLDYTTKVAKAMTTYYIEAGMDIIAVVDPVVSQISARHFKTFLLPVFTEIFEFIRSKNRISSFFVCGDATKNIPGMCESRPDSIFVDENINMIEAKKITDAANITLGGNIPLTTTMLYGTQQDNMKYVLDLIDKLPHKNLVIAPGCDMPYDVPPDNVIGVQQAVVETDAVRKTIENYNAVDDNIEVELPDYLNLPKPLVEVFTLDSDVCAACGYMRNVAFEAKTHFGNAIDVIEYKIIYKENIARVKKMQVQHLPSILINGVLKYSSIIPDRDALFEEIKKTMK